MKCNVSGLLPRKIIAFIYDDNEININLRNKSFFTKYSYAT